MRHQVFTEFDAYEDAFQHAQVQMTLHRRERNRWSLGQMSVGKLHLQWGTSGGGMVTEGEVHSGGHALFIPLSNCATNGVNGQRLDEGNLMVARSGAEFCVSADSWNDWCSLFIPYDDLGSNAPDIAEASKSGCRVVSVGKRPLSRVRQAVRKLIAQGTENSSPPATRVATESILLQFACLAIGKQHVGETVRPGRPRVDRKSVIRSFKNRLTFTAETSSVVRDLSASAEVSERTLLRIFHDWYGISPLRYMRLRQIHLVRDALLAADPRSTTVTAILTQHDVNQFGRFAGFYSSLFDESPSETLSRIK